MMRLTRMPTWHQNDKIRNILEISLIEKDKQLGAHFDKLMKMAGYVTAGFRDLAVNKP